MRMFVEQRYVTYMKIKLGIKFKKQKLNKLRPKIYTLLPCTALGLRKGQKSHAKRA